MTPATATTVRRLPLPAWEPPYDDEVGPSAGLHAGRSEHSAAVQGTLALAFLLPSGVPAIPEVPLELVAAPALRLVAPAEADEVLDEVEFGPQPTPRAALPEPRTWAGRFVQAVTEVLAGDRPASQLVRWTTTEVYDAVACRITSGARPGGPIPARAVVRSVHVTEPADGVAEVSALVRRGIRCTAVALRLEGMDGRWQCTALELG
ncbi:MAG: Rv3235 family protein [Sporichthyaceae bacterium]